VIRRLANAVNAFPEKFGEAWLPCMVAMTQGDLSVVTWKHVVIAYTVGMRTAVFYSTVLLFLSNPTRLQSVVLTGFLTFVADLATHPTHFGPFWMEAFVTGCGASAICLFVDKFRSKITNSKRRRHEVKRKRS